MDTRLFYKSLLKNLPGFAEEGGFSTFVNRTDLIEMVSKETEFSVDHTSYSLCIIESFFRSLSILDDNQLEASCWQFVSYPASLFAKSILSSLSEDSKLLDSYFWYNDAPDVIREKQRSMLHSLELQRISAIPNAQPIRHVHVAWAFIRIGDKFLLNHREDRHRPGIGNYVFAGGRINLSDLPELSLEQGLKALEGRPSPKIDIAADRTIGRELDEETGLVAGIDYQIAREFRIDDYRHLEGASAKHAYTQYDFNIYSVALNESGFFKIVEKLNPGGALKLFTIDELLNGSTMDGQKAYIDVLEKEFPDRSDRRTMFESFPVSWDGGYPHSVNKVDGYYFPIVSDCIKTHAGKIEKSYDISLDADEKSILLSLAWHAKELAFSASDDWAAFQLSGWVRINPDTEELVSNIIEELAKAGLEIFQQVDQYVRISVEPDRIYFQEDFFNYEIRRDGLEKTKLSVRSKYLSTLIGTLRPVSLELYVSDNIADAIESIARGEKHEVELESELRGIRRLETKTKLVGLSKLVKISGGIAHMTVSKDTH